MVEPEGRAVRAGPAAIRERAQRVEMVATGSDLHGPGGAPALRQLAAGKSRHNRFAMERPGSCAPARFCLRGCGFATRPESPWRFPAPPLLASALGRGLAGMMCGPRKWAAAIRDSVEAFFALILVKPSHYDDDGYVIQWAALADPVQFARLALRPCQGLRRPRCARRPDRGCTRPRRNQTRASAPKTPRRDDSRPAGAADGDAGSACSRTRWPRALDHRTLAAARRGNRLFASAGFHVLRAC